jgi:hypothetical protein
MSVITLRRALEGHTTLHIARTLSDYEQLVSLLYPWMLPQTLSSSIISFVFWDLVRGLRQLQALVEMFTE